MSSKILFEDSNWKDDNFVEKFLEDSDIYIPQRKLVLRMFLFIYRILSMEKLKKPHIIDLGCGSGILSKVLIEFDPRIQTTLVDGSSKMLEMAKTQIPPQNIRKLILSSFQDVIKNGQLEKADFIVSSLAIHHLTEKEKFDMYELIFSTLNNDGMFLNFDTVSSTEAMDALNLMLWKEWIEQFEKDHDLGRDTSLDYIPEQYKNNIDNIPSSLESQLTMFRNIGYKNIEVFYKYANFALFGGQRT